MAPPKLFYAPTEANNRLISKTPILLRHYMPSILSWNAHAAGFFGYVKLPGKRPHSSERVTMRDGGTVSLSWSAPPVEGQAVVLLLPGINNDTRLPYVRHLMRVLQQEGHTVAALDWRGLAEAGPLTGTTCTPRPYCAACDLDVSDVLNHLHAKLPSSRLYAVGFSLGAGMLLRHMGEAADACLLSAAMAVSPSLDVGANYRHMAGGLTKLYLPVIMLPLLGYLFRHRRELSTGDAPISFFRDVLPAMTTGQFGLDAIYSRAWGIDGVSAYHARGSAVHVLPDIRRTTLIVHSADDPICPADAMPLQTMAANPHIITALTRHGGHMGYTAGISPLTHTWTDRLLVNFLRSVNAPPTNTKATRSINDAAATGAPPPAQIFSVPSRL